MKAFLAVARREIEEKRFVFLAAAAASLVPFAVPIVRRLHGASAAEARDQMAVFLAGAFAFGLAVALGSTTIASDLAERRLGFFFSRPMSGFALWAGKLGAVCLTAVATAAIVYIPTFATNGGRVVLTDLPRQSALVFFGCVVAAVFVFHAGNILIRPRSPLLAADMAALVALCLALSAISSRLGQAYAFQPLETAFSGFLALATVALIAAGLRAVTRGRSDSRAAHRAFSATAWSILAAGVVAMAGYAEWVFSASPQSLTKIYFVKPAPKGSWVMLEGEARGWEPAFLLDTATGRFRRGGAGWREPLISSDGTRAAWFEPSGQGLADVITWRLDESTSIPHRTNLSLSTIGNPFLSAHGEKLATISGGVLSIWDLTTGASLGAARVGAELSFLSGSFVDRDRVRIRRSERAEGQTGGAASAEPRLDVLEFDTSTRTLATILSIEGASGLGSFSDASGDRLIAIERNRLTLRDGQTGAFLATLSERGPARQASARFLSDGRIAVAVIDGSSSSRILERLRTVHIEVFSREGKPDRTIAIPGHSTLTLGGEAAPGKLVVAAGGDLDPRSRTIFLADLSTGDLRKVADQLFPIASTAWWSSGYRESRPGEEANKLFVGPRGSLVHLDALTGERRVILGKNQQP